MEAPAAGTEKTLRGQRSWPAWVEVACALAVGKEDLQARAQSLCHTYAWERQGSSLGDFNKICRVNKGRQHWRQPCALTKGRGPRTVSGG